MHQYAVAAVFDDDDDNDDDDDDVVVVVVVVVVVCTISRTLFVHSRALCMSEKTGIDIRSTRSVKYA